MPLQPSRRMLLVAPSPCQTSFEVLEHILFSLPSLPYYHSLSTYHTVNMNGPGYYELYRKSTIGTTLTDALDTLILDQRIQPQLALRILSNFDRVVADTMKEKAKTKISFKGHLHTYRFCDDVWTFIIKDLGITLDQKETVRTDKFKIVACSAATKGT